MEPRKAILVDDERLARSSLRALLAEHPEIEIVGEAANGRQAKEMIEENRPDVVFLDIQDSHNYVLATPFFSSPGVHAWDAVSAPMVFSPFQGLITMVAGFLRTSHKPSP